MYKFLGSDQKEYGPVSAEQIRAWITQGRANGQSKLQADGSSEWKPLAQFPEFADALRAMTGSAAPPPSAGQPLPGAAPAKTSALAVTSLVLGCLGLLTCGITSLVGLVLGIVALVRIGRSKGQLGGQGFALAGTIVSAAFLVMGLVLSAMLLPALARAKQKAAGINCMNNIRQLNLALVMYADDHNERFPAGTAWCDAAKPYVGNNPKVFVCPQGTPERRCHYAFNAQLAGRGTKDIQSPDKTVLIFECDGGWNVSGGRELLPATPRHATAYVVGFADGHAEMLRPERLGQLRWEP